MGMTPLEGLVMGTRAGDVDPGRPARAAARRRSTPGSSGCSTSESGLVGLTGTQRHARHRAARRARRRGLPARDRGLCAPRAQVHRRLCGRHGRRRRDRIHGRRRREQRPRCATAACSGSSSWARSSTRIATATRRVDARSAAAIISSDESRVRLLVVRADEEREMAMQAGALWRGRLRHSDAKAATIRTGTPRRGPVRIPVAISARHAHLSQPTIDRCSARATSSRRARPVADRPVLGARRR